MKFIDLAKQQSIIREKLENRILTVLNHGKYIMGPEIKELEEKLEEYVGVRHCISCSSGTDALLISLMARNIGPGDAVLTSPFTYIATAEVISLLGATPVFIDIYPKTYNLDPAGIDQGVEFAHKQGLYPKAIIPVDLFGLPARYRIIHEQVKKYDLFILEDAAQGFGGSIRGQKACSFGHISITSFFPAKPLGCYGDGGAIFTNDDELAEVLRSIRVHGGGANKYDNIRIGINGRLDTIQAAILLEKLAVFQSETDMRNKVAEYYKANIPSNLISPYTPKDYTSSWAQFSLVAESKKYRDVIITYLKSKNIPTMIYYHTPLHLQKVFAGMGYARGDFPISEDISDRIFSIPMYPYLEKSNQDLICEALHEVV
jgi:dTDP-4-amino-4,6-dideoxygalactose transaminase